jgi:hypothetical protein
MMGMRDDFEWTFSGRSESGSRRFREMAEFVELVLGYGDVAV